MPHDVFLLIVYSVSIISYTWERRYHFYTDDYRDWHKKLLYALMSYQTSIRLRSPFSLVYGMEALLHVEVEIARFYFQIKVDDDFSMPQNEENKYGKVSVTIRLMRRSKSLIGVQTSLHPKCQHLLITDSLVC